MCKWIRESDGAKWCANPKCSKDDKYWVSPLCVICPYCEEEAIECLKTGDESQIQTGSDQECIGGICDV